MKKKLIIGIIIAHLAEVKAKKVKDEKIANDNFNKLTKEAFDDMNKNNSIVKYKEIINNISTVNLSSKNLTKLSNMKSTLGEMSKVCVVENLIESNQLTKANKELSSIDHILLEKDNILTKYAFDSMKSQIIRGLQISEGINFKQLAQILTNHYDGIVITTPTASQVQQYVNHSNFVDNGTAYGASEDSSPTINGDYVITGSFGLPGDYPDTTSKLESPTFTVNGIPAYEIYLEPKSSWESGTMQNSGNKTVVMSVTGKVYTASELEASTLKERSTNGAVVYRSISVSQFTSGNQYLD